MGKKQTIINGIPKTAPDRKDAKEKPGTRPGRGKLPMASTEKALLKKIALHIKEIRKAAGVTQEQFQSDTSIHIARIETGKFNISLNTLYRICDYFELSLTGFFEKLNKKDNS